MANREMIKAAIDHVPTACLNGLYQIVTAMQGLAVSQTSSQESWSEFLAQSYGCLVDESIERKK